MSSKLAALGVAGAAEAVDQLALVGREAVGIVAGREADRPALTSSARRIAPSIAG
jgi:hypothetical protein